MNTKKIEIEIFMTTRHSQGVVPRRWMCRAVSLVFRSRKWFPAIPQIPGCRSKNTTNDPTLCTTDLARQVEN